MRALLLALSLAASAALVGCTDAAPTEPSTSRAIQSDISAAQHTGPTAEQVGQVQPVPDVMTPHDNTIVPTVTMPFNNAY